MSMMVLLWATKYLRPDIIALKHDVMIDISTARDLRSVELPICSLNLKGCLNKWRAR